MRNVQLYYEAVNELLGEIVKASIVTDEMLGELIDDGSESARAEEKEIYKAKLHMARERLKSLRLINPPKEAATIHSVFLKAFVLGVEARQQEVAENFFAASAAYELASKELDQTGMMWDDLGMERYPEFK